MNLIVCDQSCRHQKEGYCTLNQIARLTSDTSAKCGYYEGDDAVKQLQDSSVDLPQNRQSL